MAQRWPRPLRKRSSASAKALRSLGPRAAGPPVLTPVLIASVECTAGLLADPAELRMNWLHVLVAFDIIFLAGSYLLCDTLLEE